MKLSMCLQHEVATPVNYSPDTKLEVIIDTGSGIDASPEAIAALLRGVADSIVKKPYYPGNTIAGVQTL